MTQLKGFVEKGWGSENIWCTNDKYCGKMMNYKSGSECSMHFHAEKDETWYILNGEFKISWINTKDASIHEEYVKAGDVWHNPPLMPHKIKCIEAGTIIEVSTPDSVEDNYRVLPGDSQ